MDYSVNALAKISGVSTRTLRYYDEIGLLKPIRKNSNNYRVYSSVHVDRLQTILFYKELGFELEEIGRLISAPDYDREKALSDHMTELKKRRKQLDLLIKNVDKTLASMKGKTVMSDLEKFEGFKQKLIDENEKKHGKEIRERFGDEVVNASYQKLKGMSQQKYAEMEKLTEELNSILAEACGTGDPSGKLAQKACELHKKWLCFSWPEGTYNKEAHKALAQSYVDDKRFAEYYEKIAPGCAAFLRDAINIYCGE